MFFWNLPNNSIKSNKKLIPEIDSLNSEEFQKLFYGKKHDYNVVNKEEFADLANKFDNFKIILEQYYEDNKYYPYIQDLWVNNISIEDLKQYEKNEDSFINILKSMTNKYDEWPE